MAEDRVEPREVSLSQRMPWLTIFQGFRVALDFNKLVLAAAGIITMAAGWWLLAVIFNTSEPEWNPKTYLGRVEHLDEPLRPAAAWTEYQKDHAKWRLRFRAAGYQPENPAEQKTINAADVASSGAEYVLLNRLKFPPTEAELKRMEQGEGSNKDTIAEAAAIRAGMSKQDIQDKLKKIRANTLRPAGEMRTWPFTEDRGANPYLMVTGQTKAWDQGHFWDWLLKTQIPVLLEPLIKLVRPVVFFFSPNAGTLNCFYFLLVLFWTVTTWAIFGGAITRIAAVQVARQEKLTMGEAVRFTTKRWLSFVTAPLFPMLFVGFLLVFMVLFGFIHMIPWLGDLWSGMLWIIMLIFGLLMSVAMVGLVGWPLMSATISTEGTDSWEAVSRSYSYVFQAPWYYAWNTVLALAYGAIVVFFVGFMGSFAVYLSKWGVSQTPWISSANRDPSYLFVYAPRSFDWRDLMLKGVVLNDGTAVVNPETGKIDEAAYKRYMGRDENYKGTGDTLTTMNTIGAILVAAWIWAFFLLVLGFGYSYFWSASVIIYLLMRKRVDDAELDEVYLEEDDVEPFRAPTPAPSPAPAPAPAGGRPLTMVEPPALRPPTPAAPPAPAPVPPPAPPPPPPPAPEPAAQTPPPEPEPPKQPEPPPEPPANP